MTKRPSYHIRNLGYAAAMETARKEILNVLCADPATLTVLMRAYDHVAQEKRPLEEAVHVYPDQFAHTRAAAEEVIRERAYGIVERCRAISTVIPEQETGQPRRKASAVRFPSDKFMARRQLIDEMIDIRLPDNLIAIVPQIAADRKHCDQKHADALSAECQPALQRLWDAKGAITENNLRLVNKFTAKRFEGRPDYADILQEGTIGLMRAIERWDEKARYRLPTYAKHYIRRYTTRFTQNHGSTIRVPINMHERLDKLQNFETGYLALNGQLPSADTVARHLDLPVFKVRSLRRIQRDDRPFEHPELYADADTYALHSKSSGKTSYTVLSKSGDTPRLDQIADTEQNPEAATIFARLTELTAGALRTLTPREDRVVRMRFGLEDGIEHTLEEVGVAFQVTRERIRQIESKALRKLRHPRRATALVSYVDFQSDMASEIKEMLEQRRSRRSQAITLG